MKKYLVVYLVILSLALLGCGKKEDRISKWLGSEEEMSNQIMQEISHALDKRDAKEIKELFSRHAIEEAENLDQQIKDVLEFYQGDTVSFEGFSSSQTHSGAEGEEKEFIGHFILVTDKAKYEIRYDHKPIDDSNPEETGLRKLEIVKESIYRDEDGVKREDFSWQYHEKGPGIYMQ